MCIQTRPKCHNEIYMALKCMHLQNIILYNYNILHKMYHYIVWIYVVFLTMIFSSPSLWTQCIILVLSKRASTCFILWG
jgi:hypothetical protein